MFADRFKLAGRRLMDDVAWIHGGTETATKGFYHPGYDSMLDSRADPPMPVLKGYGADFPGIAPGDRIRANGFLYDVGRVDLDEATDELAVYLRTAT